MNNFLIITHISKSTFLYTLDKVDLYDNLLCLLLQEHSELKDGITNILIKFFLDQINAEDRKKLLLFYDNKIEVDTKFCLCNYLYSILKTQQILLSVFFQDTSLNKDIVYEIN